ncbi:MAG: porin, partial [Myxococcota bacterium]
DGDSYFVTAGWYLPGEYGCAGLKGQVQPHARYQEFNNDDGADTSRWDVGINWYILQQNAKFVLTYSLSDDGVDDDIEGINLGFQLQF